jgi:hypothetical protein
MASRRRCMAEGQSGLGFYLLIKSLLIRNPTSQREADYRHQLNASPREADYRRETETR